MTSPVTIGSGGTSSISGLVSGMDTTTIVSQLMQIESQPQTLLKQQLATAQTDAATYRDINTSFAALATAAQALTNAATWATTKSTSSDASVTATASSGAAPGSFSFHVDNLAVAHSVMANRTWTNATDAFGLGATLTFTRNDGTVDTVSVTSSTSGAASLNDAVSAINASGKGLTAAAIKTSSGYALQITAAATGNGKAFALTSDTDATGANFSVGTQGKDAQISFANPGNPSSPYTSTSATNTFSTVLPGTTFTVTQAGINTTITTATDPAAVSNAVKAMVDAANAALTKISNYTDSSSGSTAPLKGDYSVISLKNQILTMVSSAVTTSSLDANGLPITSSAGSNGLQLTKDGALTFDATAFQAAFAANPTLVQQVFGGVVGVGPDGVANTPDDPVTTDGLAARLQTLADQASDTVSGMLVGLAKGQDTQATDLQSQIDDWTTRLQLRQQTLTDQFTAMETALGTLKSQSSWLSSQIDALPTWSSSSKSG
jgi:flagellar hook-associated protein 2